MGHTWTSYVAAADGCLRAAGLWNEETWKLLGLSGMGFHFIVHKELCPSSVTVYDWNNEHLECMDRIGVHSEVFCAWRDRLPSTFAQVQQTASRHILESIDRGVPVLVWAPTRILEFGLIKGYDAQKELYFVEQCTGAPTDPLPYAGLGTSEVAMLAYQVFHGRLPVEESRGVRRSLQFGLSEWKKEFHIEPEKYASGRKGYRNFVAALESGAFNEFGLGYLVAVYGDSKAALARYLSWAADYDTTGNVREAARLFEQVAGRFSEMAALAPFRGENGKGGFVDRANVPAILVSVKACFELEEQAMARIEEALKA